MAAKKQTYEQAMKRLEEIVSRIDSNESVSYTHLTLPTIA